MDYLFNYRHVRLLLFIGALVLTQFRGVNAQQKKNPFSQNRQYVPEVPPPSQVVGFEIGTQPVRYPQAVAYLKRLAEASDRVQLVEFGETFEHRKLHYLIISSKANLKQLSGIKENIGKLADPRKIASKAEAEQIIQNSPAVAWMMYGIHGDELSSPDAALQLAYRLAAGEDSLSRRIRQNVVVCIHPMENPDGRERYLAQMQQWGGARVHTDVQSIQHTGVWPWGRGNHYLFDLNRDWILLVNPESRARVREILRWNPQLMVDSHEMGRLNTYLFSPPREPINPNISGKMRAWANRFAADQAKAFDRFGWSYYTREWLEDWYPGYGSSWPKYLGAVGILYEQAGTDGSAVRRAEGTVLTFRDAVRHQLVSSLANLTTAAKNRQELLRDFYRSKQANLRFSKKSTPRVFYLPPGKNRSRTNKFLENLQWMGIEVRRAEKAFSVDDLHSYWSKKMQSKKLPAGTFIIRMDQPLQPLIRAVLEFDPRMKTSFLEEERRSLLKKHGTRIYEVTGWSLPMAYNLETYWSAKLPGVKSSVLRQIPEHPAAVANRHPAYGFLFDYTDDAAVHTLFRLLEKDYRVRVAKKPFTVAGKSFPRGSVLLRVNENPSSLFSEIEQIAQKTHTNILGVNTALAEKGVDLGGNEFQLLTAPRIAVVTGPTTSTTSFSALWYLLDQELGLKYSILSNQNFSRFDLRKYNVMVLPSGGNPETYRSMLGKEGVEKLKSWVKSGGTLIGIGNGAAFLADSSSKFSRVRLRRQVLKKLPMFQKALETEQRLRQIRVDSLRFWDDSPEAKDSVKIKLPAKAELDWLKLRDEHLRIFFPRGAILRANLDPEHWLNFGLDKKLPIILYSSYVYLAKSPVQVAARLSGGKSLRLAGLLWPEARTRWENTAYLTRESMGRGQIILFAGEPFFRAYFRGSGRMLVNSLLLGPGMGASQTVPW